MWLKKKVGEKCCERKLPEESTLVLKGGGGRESSWWIPNGRKKKKGSYIARGGRKGRSTLLPKVDEMGRQSSKNKGEKILLLSKLVNLKRLRNQGKGEQFTAGKNNKEVRKKASQSNINAQDSRKEKMPKWEENH